MTPIALLLNELRSERSDSDRRRAAWVDRGAADLRPPRMLCLPAAAIRVLRSIFAGRTDLLIENLALRQQPAVLLR